MQKGREEEAANKHIAKRQFEYDVLAANDLKLTGAQAQADLAGKVKTLNGAKVNVSLATQRGKEANISV